MISADLKKWLVATPLSAAWRGRLDLALGVALTSAAVVALGSAVSPAPEKIAELHHQRAIYSSPPPPDTGLPRQAPSIANAARAGNRQAVAWLLDHGANVNEDENAPNAPLLLADAYPEVTALLRAKGAAEPSLDHAAWMNAPNAVAHILAAHPEQAKGAGILRIAASTTTGTAENKRLIVARLLDAGADPSKSGFDNPLPSAVNTCDANTTPAPIQKDCMTIVRMLLQHGTPVDGESLGTALSLEDADRSAPLEGLARPIAPGVTSGALANVTQITPADLKRIVKMGVDWSWHDGEADAQLPLLSAARRADRDLVRELLDAGAPVDVHFKDGTCALAEAVDQSGNNPDAARVVELLVTRGANVNRRFPDGRTPLFAAAEGGDIRTVNFLIAHGARVNELVLDDMPLDAADQHGNLPAARILAAHGGRRAHPAINDAFR